jgi:predicted ATPase
MRAGIIRCRGRPPNTVYTFKHALMQDAAGATLLRAERRAIHGRLARLLEQQMPGTAHARPELLALHFSQAGLIEQAIDYWRKAAQRSLERSANVEAIEHMRQALSLLATLPTGAERDRRELDLQTQLGATLTTVKGFASPDVADAFQRARALSRETREPAHRLSVLRGLWVYDLVGAEWQTATALAEDMLTLSRGQEDSGYELEAQRALGMTLLWRGEFVHARDCLERGRRIYDPKLHKAHALRFGNDPGIACLVHEAFALWMLGYPDQAAATSARTIVQARQLAHPFSLAQALIYSAFIHQCRREPQVVLRLADEARTLAAEHGFRFWLAEATIMEGWARAACDEPTQGLTRLQDGIAEFLRTGARMDRPRWLALLAEIFAREGRTAEGLDAVTEALSVIETTKECFFEASLHQLGGELVLAQAGPQASELAEGHFRSALAVAARQSAKSWELRAATSLARLWRQQGNPGAARELLAPVYGWFTEGFDTADLVDAKAQLALLA